MGEGGIVDLKIYHIFEHTGLVGTMFGASSETGKYPSACGWFRFTIPVRGKAHVLILRSDFEII